MRTVILDSFTADQGAPACWDRLRELGQLDVYPRTPPELVIERATDAQALLTNKVLLDAGTIAELPRLEYVGIVATGTNAVDLTACRERGIAVTNVPGYSTASVAQLVFASILHLSHRVAEHDASVKRGDWAASPDFMYCLRPLVELAGKTLAVLGMGAIGSAVAEIGRGFRMHVIAAQVPGSTTAGRAPLSAALAQSDFVSLHCPLSPATRRLVDDAFLRAMKPSAVLVNTGRGQLVDEAALVRALDAGMLGGVALDVLEREPPERAHPLLDASKPWAHKLVVTPHIAWATVEARQRLIGESVENLAAFVRGDARNRVELQGEAQALSIAPGR